MYDIEALYIDRLLNKEFFCKNHAENVHQKLLSDPFFILVNKPKQQLNAINCFKNKIFWKGIIKNVLKSLLYFFFRAQSLLMDKVIKNKRDPELVSSHSSAIINVERKGNNKKSFERKELFRWNENEKPFYERLSFSNKNDKR